MMKVVICVGSSCHIKGSYDVLTRIQELIKIHNLEKVVELQASFCLGRCQEGVAMIIDGEDVANANKDTIDSIFNEFILEKLK